MRRIVFIVICCIGLFSLSSCRSTSSPCGLAQVISNQTEQIQVLEHSSDSLIADLI